MGGRTRPIRDEGTDQGLWGHSRDKEDEMGRGGPGWEDRAENVPAAIGAYDTAWLHLPGVVPIPTLPLGSEPTRDPAPALITRPPRAATLPPAHPSPAAPRVPRPAWIALRSRGPSPSSPSHDAPSPAACRIAPRTASHAGLPGPAIPFRGSPPGTGRQRQRR